MINCYWKQFPNGISEMLHIKDSFDSLERIDTIWTEETLLSSCDIKSYYTNTNHDVFYIMIYIMMYFTKILVIGYEN